MCDTPETGPSVELDPLRFVPADARAAAEEGVPGPLGTAEAFSIEVSDALALLHHGLDALIAIGERGDFAALDPAGLIGVAREFEAHRSRGMLIDSQIVEAAGEDPSFTVFTGGTNVARGLMSALRISITEANKRVGRAEKVLSRNGFSEGELPAELPRLAGAISEGAVTVEQADQVIAAMRRVATIPDMDASLREQAEEIMVGYTASLGPADLETAGKHLDEVLLPDGRGPDPRITDARRGLRVGKQRHDGLYSITGYLTAEVAARLEAVLGPLGAPVAAEDGTRDPRSADQRRHDALKRLLDVGGVPASGGTAATVHLTVDVDAILAALGLTPDDLDDAEDDESGGRTAAHDGGAHANEDRYVGCVSGGDRVTLREFMRLADEALLVPTWISGTRGVLAYGRSRRIASEGQTHALIARDGGCSFPACDVPADWCQRHHVVEWWRGGDTDLNNLTLVCGAHHRQFEQNGWRVEMIDGLPWWIPPPWIDPEQKPVINTRIRVPDQEQLEEIAQAARAAREAASRRGASLPADGQDGAETDQPEPLDDLIAMLAAHLNNDTDRDTFHQELADLLDTYGAHTTPAKRTPSKRAGNVA